MLGYHILRINYLIKYPITKCIHQRSLNYFKGSSLVMTNKIFYIFQHKSKRLVIIKYVGNGEKKVSLLLILEPVFTAKAEFLGDTCDTKWLTGETSTKDVKLLNIRHSHSMDVTMWFFTKIGFVGDLRIFVPIAGENALPPCVLKSNTKPTDSTKEVNKSEGGCFFGHKSIKRTIPETFCFIFL